MTAGPAPPHRSLVVRLWLAAIGVLVFLRYRSGIGFVQSYHGWLADRGVPRWARGLDNDLLLVLCGVVLWAWLKRGCGGRSGLLAGLGLRADIARGCLAGLAIGAPMLVLGAVTGGIFLEWRFVRIVVTGPFAEEWFFRGVLVLACVRLAGVRFWPVAIAGGVLFGAMHVQWSAAGLASGWPQGLATTAGGIWFAWLGRAWGSNLWVPVLAHATMNLASPWYGAGNGAWHETGRAATIALGTVLAVRRMRAAARPATGAGR